MGQHYRMVNLDKKQYLHPYKLGDGLKLLEFGTAGEGTMMALAALLADGNGRGGGDLLSDHPLVGSWAGDRIVIAGDYADNGRFVDNSERNLYTEACEQFEDISDRIREVLEDAGEPLRTNWT